MNEGGRGWGCAHEEEWKLDASNPLIFMNFMLRPLEQKVRILEFGVAGRKPSENPKFHLYETQNSLLPCTHAHSQLFIHLGKLPPVIVQIEYLIGICLPFLTVTRFQVFLVILSLTICSCYFSLSRTTSDKLELPGWCEVCSSKSF